MKVRDVRVAQPRLRVSPMLRGPGREHWWGRRALLLLVVGIQGGSERVWALHVLYGSRAKGSVSSQGQGCACPQASVSQVA